MKLKKLIIPALAASSLATCIVPLTSCNKETQAHFTFGKNAKYIPKKLPLAKIKDATHKDILQKYMSEIKNDPTIFYDDVHYAIDREMYVPQEMYDSFRVMPQGELNFKYFKVSDDLQRLSFELEYYFVVELSRTKPILGPTFWKYELTGRIDVYDFPFVQEQSMFDRYLAGTGDNVPFVAISLDAVKNNPWFIHAFEVGYVDDKDGVRYESAHNGWISGYDIEFEKSELGYFIEQIPFLYDYPTGGKCFNLSNYSLWNNIDL